MKSNWGWGGGLINFLPLKRGGLLEGGGLFERGGLIEDLRSLYFPWFIKKKLIFCVKFSLIGRC